MKILLQAKKAKSAIGGLIFSYVAMIDKGNGNYVFKEISSNYTHDPSRAFFEFMHLAEKYCDDSEGVTRVVKELEEIIDLENYRAILEKEDNERYELLELGRKYRDILEENARKKWERANKKEVKSKAPKPASKPAPKKRAKAEKKEKVEKIDFSDMKVTQLRKYAKDNNIKLSRDIRKKDDIVDFLERR